MTKLYGSLQNRLEENKTYCDEIKVGTGMTEYSWSDRHAYEVIEVTDQKHVTVRRLDHKHVEDGCMDNNWELISNPNNPPREMVKRGSYWYTKAVCTKEWLESLPEDPEKRFEAQLWMAHNNFDYDTVMAKGSQTRYHRSNVSFGVADYYYDYEF